MPATRRSTAILAPTRLGRALATLLATVAVAVVTASAAIAEPAEHIVELSDRIAAVDDELAELAETFAVLDLREAEVRRDLDRATSRVDRLTEQLDATRSLHQTQLDLAHRRTTLEQVDEALDLLVVRSGLAAPATGRDPAGPTRSAGSAAAVTLDAAAPRGGGTAVAVEPAAAPRGGGRAVAVQAATPAATSASPPSAGTRAPHPGHLQLRYAVRASMVFATLHLQLDEAEQATVAPRRELDGEVAPARRRLQARLQDLLAVRDELVDSLAVERALLERTERLQLPVTAAHRVSSRFGMRRHPVHGDVRMHTGLDLAAPIGTPVSAAAAGRVVAAGSRGGYGLTVDVDHGGGLLTRYAHLDRIEVARGDRLAAGQRLGTVGMTGTVTGPHLHLEVREHGRAVDPAEWLSAG